MSKGQHPANADKDASTSFTPAKAAKAAAVKPASKAPRKGRSSTVTDIAGSRSRRRTDDDGAVDAFRGLLATVDSIDRALLVNAVTTGADIDTGSADGLDEDLFGTAPSDAEVVAARIETTKLEFARRRRVIDESLSREAAAQLLDVSRETIRNYLEAGDLLGLRAGKRWMFPLWQFDADSECGIVPGIAAVNAAFAGGVTSLTRWMTTDNVNFNARTPRQVLAAGHTEAVTAAAAALTAAGW